MGQEWAAPEPFLFFADLGKDLAPLVSEGRRREIRALSRVRAGGIEEQIPDPQAETTRARSVLRWDSVGAPSHAEWLAFHRHLLEVRAKDIAPLLRGEPVPETRLVPLGDTGLEVTWTFPTGACFDSSPTWAPRPWGTRPGPGMGQADLSRGHLAGGLEGAGPLTVRWYLSEGTP